MKTKIFLLMLIAILVLVMFTGCVPGGNNSSPETPAGFFWGIWHGWIAPISLIMSFFDDRFGIYEIYNRGWTYDLGFYMAIISGFGGISIFRKIRD